jgi:tRNA-splicing ligase RtcB (3'-phosphate/5'-hydroxy nucleic acid ligase)
MSDDTLITGSDLIELGFAPDRWFGEALSEINERKMSLSQAARVAQRYVDAIAKAEAERQAREIPLRDKAPDFQVNLTADTEEEQANRDAVVATFSELMRTPVLERGVVMPDACPAGPMGTIPVGGVVAARNAILPGAHSADICCSMTATVLENGDPKAVLDALQAVSHFGPGGRSRHEEMPMPKHLQEMLDGHPMLNSGRIKAATRSHLGGVGDGNHFVNLCRSKATGKLVIVSHFGSRGPGAMLYKIGMEIAERYRQDISPETLPGNAWIPADSEEGKTYWSALQIMREWTKRSHESIHNAAIETLGLDIHERFWNEHNFVFEEDDGSPDGKLYWHAKGATPIHTPLLPDTSGVQIVPLNMAQPILLVRGERTEGNLGFAPHGAGRNMSRTAHKRKLGDRPVSEVFAEETAGIDARFASGHIDTSELPSAYKNADAVRADMKRFALCDVVDELAPYGSIMAGDDFDAPWRKKARAKAEAKARAAE